MLNRKEEAISENQAKIKSYLTNFNGTSCRKVLTDLNSERQEKSVTQKERKNEKMERIIKVARNKKQNDSVKSKDFYKTSYKQPVELDSSLKKPKLRDVIKVQEGK